MPTQSLCTSLQGRSRPLRTSPRGTSRPLRTSPPGRSRPLALLPTGTSRPIRVRMRVLLCSHLATAPTRNNPRPVTPPHETDRPDKRRLAPAASRPRLYPLPSDVVSTVARQTNPLPSLHQKRRLSKELFRVRRPAGPGSISLLLLGHRPPPGRVLIHPVQTH